MEQPTQSNTWEGEKGEWVGILDISKKATKESLHFPSTKYKGWNCPASRLAFCRLKCQGLTFFPLHYIVVGWFMSSFKLVVIICRKGVWGQSINNHKGLGSPSPGWNVIRWMWEEAGIALDLRVYSMESLCLPGQQRPKPYKACFQQ